MVANPPFPRLTGYEAIILLLLNTCIVCVALLMIERCLAPTEKLEVQSPRPQIPLPTSNPVKLAVTVTLVPAGQNVAGRKWTTFVVSQCQPPVTAGVDGTWMRSSRAARAPAGIAVLKRRSMVSPTPTTAPSSGVIPVSRRLLAVSVTNVVVDVEVEPAVLVAVATTV